MQNDKIEVYTTRPIPQAVISLAVPTIISQLITVAYNMADTFFIGQLNDPDQVAAATLSMPVFVLLTGIANLFGIGGSSLISRCLGKGQRDLARSCASFCIWTAAIVAQLYGLIFLLFRTTILPALGTNADTYTYCYQYLFWTVIIGSVPTVLNAELAHLIRTEGRSKEAGFGVAMGGLFNILLDPLFIFVFDLQIAGAAIATMLSNCVATAYFFFIIYRNRQSTVILPDPRAYSVRQGLAREVLLIGLPSFVMLLMGTVSNTVLNNLVSSYSNEAIAGMGIAKRIDMLAFAIGNGMTQGVISLIAFNYAAKNYRRMIQAIRTTFLYTLGLALAGTLFLFTCAASVARFFIDNTATVEFGQSFLRVICLTCPAISVTMIIITIFQAMGNKLQPLILSLLRKGSVDIPFMFLMNHLTGASGIAWATPISDILVMLTAVLLFLPQLKKLLVLSRTD